MKFVALDVETANANMASICSIGAAVFEDGKVISEFYSLIDPEDYFDAMNVSIHGIGGEMVVGAPIQHHHALEDAKAAGQIILAAAEKNSFDLEGFLRRVRLPINPNDANAGGAIRRDGNPDGPLNGEVIVFTGALQIRRSDAADLAAGVGCDVATSVTKNTTMLVVGDTDVTRLAGHAKSQKHRDAEDRISKGFPIRIIRETDFQELVSSA